MKRFLQNCSWIVAVCLALSSTSLHAENAGIHVSGSAKISVAPDMAHFSFAVNGRGKLLPELKTDIDKKTSAVIALCKKLGVEPKYISSAEISIHPQYNHQSRELIGYDVNRSITVELHDLSRYTDLVNGAIESGITTINNISLGVNDREKLEAEALARAVNAAETKASIIADNAKIELGKIISVQESGSTFDNRRYGVKQMAFSEAAADVFEPGEISVTATVSVTYAIK